MTTVARIWIQLPETDEAGDVLTTALERGVDTFLPPDDRDLTHLGDFREAAVADGEVRIGDETVGRRVTIEGKEAQSEAFDLVGEVDVLLVATPDWTVIPVENLIAEAQDESTTLLAEVDDPDDARLLLETLEVGVDGVLYRAETPGDVLDLHEALPRDRGPTVDLATATIRDVRPVGNGDRVCVDTASLLEPGEGMLVGSSNSSLFLVHGETLESDYVASRPFRVNAGPVHAYLLGPDGQTRYLSELRSGDEVLVVDREGRTRTAVLGRVKIENRPLLLVEAEDDAGTFTTLVQNAETIRLTGPDGPKSVTDLEAGDEVLVRREEGGRHFGRAVDETVEER